MIALDEQAHNEFEWLNHCSQGPPLILEGLRGFRLSSSKSRKNFPLESDAWKSILYYESITLHSVFLQKS